MGRLHLSRASGICTLSLIALCLGSGVFVTTGTAETINRHLMLHQMSSSSSQSSVPMTARMRRLLKRKRRTKPIQAATPSPSRRSLTASSAGSSNAAALPSVTYEKARCGDGYITGNEACDDANATGNDGCSASCTIETGFNCNGAQPTRCLSLCGDSVVATNEQCDDGNTSGGDGCDYRCKVEFAYKCTGSPSVCTGICGNGLVQAGEECDDSNTKSGDGCSSTCTVESSSSSS